MKAIPERAVAIAAGESFYFTGKPCSKGHISKRYVTDHRCAKCASEASLRWAAKTPWHPLRQAAKNAGQPRYNLGKPCANGHSADRYTSNGFCVICDAAKNKRFHTARPGLEAQWARKRRAKDPTGHRADVKRWREKNREKADEALKRWRAANPERVRILRRVGANNRRAREAANGGSFTVADVEALYAKQNSTCAACPCSENLQIDHILPIILDGSSDPSNLQLLCARCNRSKGGKHPDLWRSEIRKPR